MTRLGLALRTKSLNDELRLADVSLRSAVLTDSLTGLVNRRAAEERLRSLTGLARLRMGPVSMILADLDGFAEVNERLGYAMGDRLLQAFAGLLQDPAHGRGQHLGVAALVADGHLGQGARLRPDGHAGDRGRGVHGEDEQREPFE